MRHICLNKGLRNLLDDRKNSGPILAKASISISENIPLLLVRNFLSFLSVFFEKVFLVFHFLDILTLNYFLRILQSQFVYEVIMKSARHHYSARHCQWSREEEQLLGTKSNRALARKFGRTTLTVVTRRWQLGNSLRKPWRPEDDKLLGLRPDEQVAMFLKRPRYQVAYRRRQLDIPFKHPNCHLWKPGEIAMLGWKTDEAVARLTGRNVKNVRH